MKTDDPLGYIIETHTDYGARHVEQIKGTGESWTLRVFLRGTWTDEEIMHKFARPETGCQGNPGGTAWGRPYIRRVGKRVVFKQEGCLDI